MAGAVIGGGAGVSVTTLGVGVIAGRSPAVELPAVATGATGTGATGTGATGTGATGTGTGVVVAGVGITLTPAS
jgi:hypothetical protein